MCNECAAVLPTQVGSLSSNTGHFQVIGSPAGTILMLNLIPPQQELWKQRQMNKTSYNKYVSLKACLIENGM